jgi:hypothetical protein
MLVIEKNKLIEGNRDIQLFCHRAGSDSILT